MRQQQCAVCRACGETFVALPRLTAEQDEAAQRCPYCTSVGTYEAAELFFA